MKNIEEQVDEIRNYCEEVKPLVAVLSLTYNHRDYIRDALDGFVTQKTNFPFVVIVHDDASTDGTDGILREYAEKYPDIIKPIFEKENQYSKRNGSITKLMDEIVELSGAKYIAMCEGDDYWIDTLKLQKQVDFMEAHPDYTICFHNAKVENNELNNITFNSLDNREYFSNDVFKEWIVPTASILYRNGLMPPPKDKRINAGDIVLILNAMSQGRGYGMSDIMSVYRIQEGGVTLTLRRGNVEKRARRYLNHFIFLSENYNLDKQICRKYILYWENIYIKEVYKRNKIKGILLFINQSFRYPRLNSTRIFNKLKNKLIGLN